MKSLSRLLKYPFVASLIVALLLAGGAGIRRVQADSTTGSACAALTVDNPQSAACDAEIDANPLPDLVRPVALDKKTQGASTPRSILLPKAGLPYSIGWMISNWYYADTPGVIPATFADDHIVKKADLVYIYTTIVIKDMEWHLIGKGRWMQGDRLAALRIPTKPDKVTGRWIALDLAEQTLVAMDETNTAVFATLISASYYGYGFTREGLFNIYARTKETVFRGPPWAKIPEYIYNHVPDVMFFDGHIALHGAYWHDNFGYARTHGCVNIPVGDEHWLWNWVSETADQWGPDQNHFFLPHPDKSPFVYVYRSNQIKNIKN